MKAWHDRPRWLLLLAKQVYPDCTTINNDICGPARQRRTHLPKDQTRAQCGVGRRTRKRGYCRGQHNHPRTYGSSHVSGDRDRTLDHSRSPFSIHRSPPSFDSPSPRNRSCFDLNFPFLNQLSHNHVDIMLQPSATWGTIGDSHAFVNRLRAVEHGVTLVRCASNGVSGVFDAFHRVVGQQYTLGRGDGFVGRVPLYGRRVTAFAVWGELWGWTCVGATVVLLVLATAGPWRQRTYRGIILP